MLVEAASCTVELEVHMEEGLLFSGKQREAIDEEEERGEGGPVGVALSEQNE